MRAIPKFLNIITLLAITSFVNAEPLEKAYSDYRKAYNADQKSDSTSNKLEVLQETCTENCNDETCSNLATATICKKMCSYERDCLIGQGLSGKQITLAGYKASLGDIKLDDNGIPITPLPQEPSIAAKGPDGTSPTQIVEIRIKVDNPSASCEVNDVSSKKAPDASSKKASDASISSRSSTHSTVNAPSKPNEASIQAPAPQQPSQPKCTPAMIANGDC